MFLPRYIGAFTTEWAVFSAMSFPWVCLSPPLLSSGLSSPACYYREVVPFRSVQVCQQCVLPFRATTPCFGCQNGYLALLSFRFRFKSCAQINHGAGERVCHFKDFSSRFASGYLNIILVVRFSIKAVLALALRVCRRILCLDFDCSRHVFWVCSI